MTPKEKAEELVDKFSFSCRECDNSKQCALIAVDIGLQQFVGLYKDLKDFGIVVNAVEDTENYKYWQQVKKEIEEI